MFKKHFSLMDGEPGGGASGPSNPPASDPSNPPASGGNQWYEGFKDQDIKDWLKSYNDSYPDPESLAVKAYNLEKFIGADKSGRGVVVPKSDAKPEEWKAFYSKVGGVPEKPDGYKLPDNLASDPMAAKFREHAHASGMPPMFFESVLSWYQGQGEAIVGQKVSEFATKSEADLESLRTEWVGVEYDKNVELGRRAAKQFVPHENAQELEQFLTRIEGAIGTKSMMKLFANIGNSIGEHSFASGEGDGGMGGGVSPESARVRISQLKKDSAWNAKFSNGDAEARAEWDRLHKAAYSQ